MDPPMSICKAPMGPSLLAGPDPTQGRSRFDPNNWILTRLEPIRAAEPLSDLLLGVVRVLSRVAADARHQQLQARGERASSFDVSLLCILLTFWSALKNDLLVRLVWRFILWKLSFNYELWILLYSVVTEHVFNFLGDPNSVSIIFGDHIRLTER